MPILLSPTKGQDFPEEELPSKTGSQRLGEFSANQNTPGFESASNSRLPNGLNQGQ